MKTLYKLSLGISLLLLPALLQAQAPAWWSQRGVTNGNPADDFAAANQGQVKNIAVAAVAELNANLPGGAGDTLCVLAKKLSTPNANTDDYVAVNIGQLKNLAKPFYDRLLAAGYRGRPLQSGTYPWIGSATPPDDFAMANIGQVKNLFCFDLAPTKETPTVATVTPASAPIVEPTGSPSAAPEVAISIAPTRTQVILSWPTSPNTPSYIIKVSPDGGATWQTVTINPESTPALKAKSASTPNNRRSN